jgi:hypothetical protein
MPEIYLARIVLNESIQRTLSAVVNDHHLELFPRIVEHG